MAYIEIYTKKDCPYCKLAKMFFIKRSLSFKEIAIDQNLNNKDSNNLSTEMHKRSNGRTTVPQIFINGKHIGGSDDLIHLNNQKKLDKLLNDPAS